MTRRLAGACVCALAFACAERAHDVPVLATVGRPAASTDAQVELDRAVERIRSGDAAGAIDDLTRVIELDPRLAMAYAWRGHCLNLVGMSAEALADYDRAIQLDPGYAWSHYARGMACHNLGRFEEAIAGYTRSIELDPTFVKAWHWRGFTRKLVGDYAGSASDLERGLALQPDDPWALSELAKVRQALGDFDGCRSTLERIVSIDPSNASSHAQLGFLFAVTADHERSFRELDAACTSSAPEATYARVWIWMQRDDRGQADTDLRAWSRDARIDDPWEQELVAFLLGDGTDAILAERARVETQGRIARGAPKDFLECEAAFYAGLRAERRGDLAAARDLYARARATNSPEAWEWAMAEVRAQSLER